MLFAVEGVPQSVSATAWADIGNNAMHEIAPSTGTTKRLRFAPEPDRVSENLSLLVSLLNLRSTNQSMRSHRFMVTLRAHDSHILGRVRLINVRPVRIDPEVLVFGGNRITRAEVLTVFSL